MFTEANDDGSGVDNWSYKQRVMEVVVTTELLEL